MSQTVISLWNRRRHTVREQMNIRPLNRSTAHRTFLLVQWKTTLSSNAVMGGSCEGKELHRATSHIGDIGIIGVNMITTEERSCQFPSWGRASRADFEEKENLQMTKSESGQQRKQRTSTDREKAGQGKFSIGFRTPAFMTDIYTV